MVVLEERVVNVGDSQEDKVWRWIEQEGERERSIRNGFQILSFNFWVDSGDIDWSTEVDEEKLSAWEKVVGDEVLVILE